MRLRKCRLTTGRTASAIRTAKAVSRSTVASPESGAPVSLATAMHSVERRRGVGHGAHVGDDRRALLRLLQAGERHLVAGNIAARLLEVLRERLVGPFATVLLHRLGVAEVFAMGDRSSDHAPEVRSDAVTRILVEGVAGDALPRHL